MRSYLTACAISVLLPTFLNASDQISGTATLYESPNGVSERCVQINPLPGANYSKSDLEDQSAYCEIDLYAADVALCPKTWSTSPGMMVYDISEGPYANDRAAFERNACKEGKSASDLAKDSLAKFKVTMNQKGTSGTFGPSSLLYYHFSRYFGMDVKVPVAVWRSMDKAMHTKEVAGPGLAISGTHARMNHEGWRWLVESEENPARYAPTDDLFTADRKSIYGVMVSSPGHRYGAEINGTRRSGWGQGQNNDFQETPAFLALRTKATLEEAVASGLRQGRKDSTINKGLGPDVTNEQMVFWMRELSEIVLLDFIFSQQDRVGNIDFTPYYYWAEDGDVKHKRAKHHDAGDGTVPPDAQLIRRTNLNDNDAGGRVQYANFAKSTGMLEKLRHFDGGVYRKLLALDADLQAQGPIYLWTATSLGLADREIAQIVKNTRLATAILQDSCRAGNLIFDLNPKGYFLSGETKSDTVDCNAD